MAAKAKLNAAYLGGSFVLALFLGAAANSTTVFVIAIIVLIGINVNSKNIR